MIPRFLGNLLGRECFAASSLGSYGAAIVSLSNYTLEMFATIGKGSCLVLASQVFAVIVHSLAKFLETTGDVEPQQILQVRMFVTLSLNCVFLIAWLPRELPLRSHQLGYLSGIRVLGGICGAFGFYCKLNAFPETLQVFYLPG